MNIKKTTKEKTIVNEANNKDLLIIGIGASAGGLEALESFFGNLPDDCGMAFVVIQHLDPNHIGIMPELLQRYTQMKVTQSVDGEIIKPDCVYVIPPNKSMSVLKGALHLFEPIETRGLRLPIDVFFHSLAEDKHENSVGVILSGMGSDGSVGIKSIKENGGIVLVQDPLLAQFDSMPRAAIESVIPDVIAAANVLPVKLIEILSIEYRKQDNADNLLKNQNSLDKITILLRDRISHDFSQYKKNTLFRRIDRRKNVHQISRITDYVRFLQENPTELDILFKEFLIGVTSFFRDAGVWSELKDKIFPELYKNLPERHIIRAWIPACSTGEEAYTLAIVFKEFIEKTKNTKNISLQIFATDIDLDAVEKARKGVFSKSIEAELSPDRLNRFFTNEPEGYKIITSIREMVVFAPQNVIKDPPFTKLDLISCRNLMIYLESELQSKLIGLFNYSLNTGGILIIGTAESLGNKQEGYKELAPKLKIFKRLNTSYSQELIDFPSSFQSSKTRLKENKALVPKPENIAQIADQIILQQFAPASVLVTAQGDIVYITGKTGKYLEPVAGKANWNIHAMARVGLKQVLPSLFKKALLTSEPVQLNRLEVGCGDNPCIIDLVVQQIENPESVQGMVLIVFKEINQPREVMNKETGKPQTTKHKITRELQEQLKRSNEEIRSLREEMQTSQEELKSTNEELQSTNEELQSTNEELTTSKEEMQSLNEELQTVNIELQSKVSEFVRANDDMKNLLNSTEIATLFLDKDLHIRRYTDEVVQIFKLRPSDVGRPFTDLVTDLDYSDMEMHSKQVMKTLISSETAAPTNDGRWYNVRIMPYRTIDDRIEGLVITFSDITKSKKLELELLRLNETLVNNKTNT